MSITSSYIDYQYNSACWTLVYLAANTEWREKVVAEVRNLIAAHTNMPSTEPAYQRLSTIPLAAWEDGMPDVERRLRETLRLVANGTLLRRNLADNLQVGGKTIDKGAFLAYNVGEVQLNDKIYSEPYKFDPGRFHAPREEHKRGSAVFLAWGSGRHPCAGQFLH